ncbi:hypothetical protein, partial [Aeromonas caviae]
QKRVIDQNGRSPSSTENSKIRCGMTDYSSLTVYCPQGDIVDDSRNRSQMTFVGNAGGDDSSTKEML